jgi:hypothetical protein
MDDFLLYSIESFPPMPESITKLNELYARPEINSKEVEGIIQADPVLYRYLYYPFSKRAIRNPRVYGYAH